MQAGRAKESKEREAEQQKEREAEQRKEREAEQRKEREAEQQKEREKMEGDYISVRFENNASKRWDGKEVKFQGRRW